MTKMSSLNYMELCRLCLVKEKVSVPIFEGEGGERQIFDKIATCLPVKVSQDDKLPKKICSDCVYRVENSYQFWNTTSNSEKQLLEWVVNDVKVDSKNLVSDNITMETEQLVLKEEAIDHDQTAADVAKSLSRVEAVLTEEAGQPGGVSEEEEEEEDSDDGGGGGGGEDSNSEESGEEPPGKEEIESEEEEEEEEPYEELEPTTFVNVSLACDEAGPSGIQQTRQQTKQDSQTSAASASATTANAEAPSTSAADPAASGWKEKTKSGNLTRANKNTSLKLSRKVKKSVKATCLPRLRRNDKEAKGKVSNTGQGGDLDTDPGVDLWYSIYDMYRKMESSAALANGKYLCNICGKICSSKTSFRYHLEIHSEVPKYKCDVCDKQFQTYPRLFNHRLIHRKSKDQVCDVCGYCTYYKAALDIHKMLHSQKFKLYCEICSKGFKSKCYYDDHMNTHTGNNPYICDICGKAFPCKSNLANHKIHHKPGYKPYSRLCEICGISVQRSSYESHQRRHNNEMYDCDICGKKITKKNSLITHMRMHMNDKPHACEFCGKMFGSTRYLRLHRRVHTGEKPHMCQFCQKSFSQRSSLIIHTRNHTGEKPYTCDICNHGFVSRNQLTNHNRAHHSEQSQKYRKFLVNDERTLTDNVLV